MRGGRELCIKPGFCNRKNCHDLQVVEQMDANKKGFSPNILLAKAKFLISIFPRPEGRGYCKIWVKFESS